MKFKLFLTDSTYSFFVSRLNMTDLNIDCDVTVRGGCHVQGVQFPNVRHLA